MDHATGGRGAGRSKREGGTDRERGDRAGPRGRIADGRRGPAGRGEIVGGKEPEIVGVLEVKRPDSEPTRNPLRAGESLRVGREADNQLVLDDVLVSRYHAVFNGSMSGIILSDLS